VTMRKRIDWAGDAPLARMRAASWSPARRGSSGEPRPVACWPLPGRAAA